MEEKIEQKTGRYRGLIALDMDGTWLRDDKSVSDGMRKTVEKMSSKRPTLESRRRSVIQYGQEASDMKSKATSENRNIGSKAFRR